MTRENEENCQNQNQSERENDNESQSQNRIDSKINNFKIEANFFFYKMKTNIFSMCEMIRIFLFTTTTEEKVTSQENER